MAARFLERGTELLVHAEKPGRDHHLDVGSARAGRDNDGCQQGKQVSEISRHGTAPQMRPACNVPTKAGRRPAPTSSRLRLKNIRFHSGLAPAALMIGHYFSVSAA